jgi:hypothetical protein
MRLETIMSHDQDFYTKARPSPEPEPLPVVGPSTRNARRRAEPDTLTALLSCKPLDVELRRLQRAALRRLKNKGKR